MKNKETFWLLLFLLVTFFLFCSCSTRKKIEKTQESTVQESKNEWAKDSSIIEYKVDTSKLCDQIITLEVVDYYPTIDTATHTQAIKQIRRKTVSKSTTDKAIIEQKQAELKETAAESVRDSSGKQAIKEKTAKPSAVSRIWLWILLLLLITTIGYYCYRKLK